MKSYTKDSDGIERNVYDNLRSVYMNAFNATGVAEGRQQVEHYLEGTSGIDVHGTILNIELDVIEKGWK